MRAGELGNGERVLRVKFDVASADLNLRDSVIYRILNASHRRISAAYSPYPSLSNSSQWVNLKEAEFMLYLSPPCRAVHPEKRDQGDCRRAWSEPRSGSCRASSQRSLLS
jgi:hypothetical protein